MTLNHQDMARAWARSMAGLDSANSYTDTQARRGNVNPNGDRIDSYGHWEMARIQRDRRGNPVRFLINGDSYGTVSTARHQTFVRRAIAETQMPSIILPYSVLDEAGIDRNSLAPLDVQDDWNTTTIISQTENPGRWAYEYGTVYDDFGGWQNSLTGEVVLRSAHYGYGEKPEVTCEHTDLPVVPEYPFGSKFEGGYASDEYKAAMVAYVEANEARETHFDLHHGRWEELPASTRQTGHKRIVSGPNGRLNWDMVDDGEGGVLYQREQYRHWLGASLVVATVRYRDSNTGATRTRRARFLSGFDQNETRPSYFFCELPRTSKALTVEEAYEDLKPATVKVAEQMGREVVRQGDIFAVPMQTVTTSELRKLGAARAKQQHILGTNHKATEVATIGKLTYVRGTLTHAPANRQPDHKRVTVGKIWHLVLKNTVPVTA